MSTRNALDIAVFADWREYLGADLVGGNWDILAPVDARSELIMAGFEITTDANVANRELSVNIVRGGEAFLLGSSCFAHVASTTWWYMIGQVAGLNTVASFGTLYVSIPSAPIVRSPDTIRFFLANAQVGDTWRFRSYALKQWSLA